MKNKDVYQEVTNQIIEQLKDGVIPWEKPWETRFPRSLSTGNRYRGTNLLTLTAESLRQGYASNFWGTFNQVKNHGGHVRKGESATKIVFCKTLEGYECDECGEIKRTTEEITDHVSEEHGLEYLDESAPKTTIPLLRYFSVFNLDQTTLETEDIPYEMDGETDGAGTDKEAEEIVSGYEDRPEITTNGSKAFYDPAVDRVGMPRKDQFRTTDGYYYVLFHELTHSTGHPDRLDREGVSGVDLFGSVKYTHEELIAEIGASFLGRIVGIESERKLENRAAYIQSWIEKLEEDEKAIVRAASRAQEAVDYIMEGMS